MDAPAPPPFENAQPIRARIAALEQQTRGLRRDLKDAFDLIERLKDNSLIIEAKIVATEHELALLRKEAERLLRAQT